MIRKKAHVDLDPWLERACASLVASFANGVKGQGCRQRRDHDVLVQRTNRRPDHQAQAGQASNVRTRQARLASGSSDMRYMTTAAPKLRQSQNCTPNNTHGRGAGKDGYQALIN